jgi:hypothetical protein
MDEASSSRAAPRKPLTSGKYGVTLGQSLYHATLRPGLRRPKRPEGQGIRSNKVVTPRMHAAHRPGIVDVRSGSHGRDPIRQLRIGADIHRRLHECSWRAANILHSAHGRDESLTQIWDQWQQRLLAAMRRGIGALHAQRALRPGLSLDEAVDTFYALAGTDIYRTLVRERGWTPERYEAWLFGVACRELVDCGLFRQVRGPGE